MSLFAAWSSVWPRGRVSQVDSKQRLRERVPPRQEEVKQWRLTPAEMPRVRAVA
jgi:hypothetical protein